MAGAPISCQDATGTADLRRVVGLADLCELLAITFAFPADDGLAAALASGTYLSDATGCLADAGYPASQVQDACRKLETFVGRDVTELAQDLRRGHSLLFLSPGSQGPVWPYEGAFRFAATGTAEAPSLFRSPVTLQVEKAMGEAGLLPATARTEPVDSIWGELGFLSQLYGHQAQAAVQALALAQGSANNESGLMGRPCCRIHPTARRPVDARLYGAHPLPGRSRRLFPWHRVRRTCPVWGRGGAGADSR